MKGSRVRHRKEQWYDRYTERIRNMESFDWYALGMFALVLFTIVMISIGTVEHLNG